MEKNKKPSKMAFVVEVGAIGLVGLAAIVVSVFGILDSKYIFAALFALTSFVLFQLVGTRDTIERLVQSTDKLSADVDAFRVLNTSNLIDAGLVNAYKKATEFNFDAYFASSKRSIRIMQTWFPQADPFPPGFVNAIRLGTSVQLLLLDPESLMAKQRLRDLGRSEDSSLPHVGIETMLAVIKRHSLDYEKIEVRYYKNLPTLSLYAVDDRMIVSFFWQRHGSTSGPLIEVLSDTSPFGAYIDDTFKHIWNQAVPFDIAAKMTELQREA